MDIHRGVQRMRRSLDGTTRCGKETNLNAPAIKQWLSVGAQPSETVEKLLKKAMIMDP